MREAVAQGPAAVEALPRATVYIWLSKIFYGILYRESLLRADRNRASDQSSQRHCSRNSGYTTTSCKGFAARLNFQLVYPVRSLSMARAYPIGQSCSSTSSTIMQTARLRSVWVLWASSVVSRTAV